jgi:tRNA (guanine-N7-)-methyltransferase
VIEDDLPALAGGESETGPQKGPVKHIYGRRKGRPLRAHRQRVLEELLPQLAIKTPGAGSKVDPIALFGHNAPIWFEVGFGGGEHLADQAEQHPEINFIGAEYFINGVASLLKHVDERQITNVRILQNDARLLLECLPEGVLERVFVLFADPWRKARHTNRRFIQAETLALLARLMPSGAELRLASDHPKLIEWYDEVLPVHTTPSSPFELVWRRPLAEFDRPADWPNTRYEQKGIAEGREPIYWLLRRRQA